MGGTGAAVWGVGKKRSREREITLVGDEAKPMPSIPAALSASSSSICPLLPTTITRGILRLADMILAIDSWGVIRRTVTRGEIEKSAEEHGEIRNRTWRLPET